jgi:hypothetical protein
MPWPPKKICKDNPAGWYLRIMILLGEWKTMQKGFLLRAKKRAG